MPALFAYLLAIGIFIGGSYAGLIWLTSPPSARPEIHSSSSRPQQAGPASNSKLPATHDAGRERDDASSPSYASREQPPQSEVAKADGSETSKERNAEGTQVVGSEAGAAHSMQSSAQPSSAPSSPPDARASAGDVPSGACMPIGMTAQGDLVFPLQCREVLERHRGPGPAVEGRLSQGTQQGSVGHRGETAQHAGTGRDPASASPAISRTSPNAQPDVGATTASAPEAQTQADDTPTTGQNGNPRKLRQKKTNNVPPDERSAPPARSPTVVSQSDEWFNPLGLR
jgi:hypothetical protein